MKVLIATTTGPTQNSMEICRAVGTNPLIELSVVLPRKVAADKFHHPSGWLVVEHEQHSDGFRLIPVPLRDPQQPQRGFQWRPLLRVIRQTDPEIIHVWEEPLSYRFFQLTWLRVIAQSRAKVLFYGFQNISFTAKWLQRMLWKLTWKHVAGGAMANSEGVQNLRLLGFAPGSHLKHMFYGIPTHHFRPLKKQEQREKLNLDCPFVVGYLGRLVPEKGLDWLLDALERLPANVHGVVVGEGSQSTSLEARVAATHLRSRVHFLGVAGYQQTPKLINCFDVLAVPSLTTTGWKEQYGRVIAEAMACGVPVVGSDCGAIPEVLGSVGFVVPQGDTKKLAEALQYVLFDNDVRDRCIREGLRRSEEEMSVTAMGSRLVEFYHRIVAT
jgi:glycosyltransferase involved in cell wall biosynthesis